MTKFTGHKATHMLEKFDATYNGGNSFTIHFWDYDTNTCHHYDITRNENGDIELPTELLDLYDHPRHIARRAWNERRREQLRQRGRRI